MNLLNETLAIAYGEDKAKEIMNDAVLNRSIDTFDRKQRDINIVNNKAYEVVTSTAHRYLEDEKK